jgi:lipoate-protein ligase A
VLGERKLVGSAQWRCDGALLQHGSILVDDDQVQITSLLASSPLTAPAAASAAPAAPATLREALGNVPTMDDVGSAFFAAIQQIEDAGVEPMVVEGALARAAVSLRAHYLDSAWTWRR